MTENKIQITEDELKEESIPHISLKHRFIYLIRWNRIQDHIQEFEWKGVLFIPLLLCYGICILWVYLGAILLTILHGIWFPLSFILGGKYQFQQALTAWDEWNDYEFGRFASLIALIFVVFGAIFAIVFLYLT